MNPEPSIHAAAIRRFLDPAYLPKARSLAEVRNAIDTLDREIVKLLAERAAWVADATRFKRDAAQAAAPARQAQVFRQVRSLAQAQNVALPDFADLAEAVYRTLVAEYVAREQSLLDQTELIGDTP